MMFLLAMLLLCIRGCYSSSELKKLTDYCSGRVTCLKESEFASVTTEWLHATCAGQSAENGSCFRSFETHPGNLSCRPAQTRLPGRVVPFVKSYAMIEHCPDATAGAVSCRDLPGLPDGIYPVSSPEGQVYINKECAVCNGVTEVYPWDVVVICKKSSNLYTSYTTDVLSSLTDGPCDVIFWPPEEQDVSNVSCPQSIMILDPCNNSESWDSLQLNADTIRASIAPSVVDASTSEGLSSLVYGNAFCLSCGCVPPSSQCLTSDVQCTLEDTRSLRFHVMFYTLILNRTFFEMATSDKESFKKMNINECMSFRTKEYGQVTCRHIHCPEGQIRTQDGRCQFYATEWAVSKIVILLDLWIPDAYNIESWMFDQLSETEVDAMISEIKDKYVGNGWDILLKYGMRIVAGKMSSRVSLCKLFLMLEANRIDISMVYNTIMVAISSNWEINIGGFNVRGPVTVSRLRTNEHSFRKLASQPNALLNGRFYVTMTYFCHQVEVYGTEYEKRSFSVISVDFLGRTFGNDEYVLQSGELGANDSIVRLCLDELLPFMQNYEDTNSVPTFPGQIYNGGAMVSKFLGATIGLGTVGMLVLLTVIYKQCRGLRNRSANGQASTETELSTVQGP